MGTGTGTGTFMLIKSGNCVYGVAMLFWVFRFRFRVATFFHLPPRVAPGRNRKGMTHPAPGCTCPLLLNRKNFVTDGGVKFRNEFSKLAHCNFCNTRVHGHEACGQEVCFCLKLLEFSWLLRGWNLWWLQGAGWWVVDGWSDFEWVGLRNSWCSRARMRPVLGRSVVNLKDPCLASALVCFSPICLRECRGF